MAELWFDFLDVGMGDGTLVWMSDVAGGPYELALVDFGEKWSPEKVAIGDALTFLAREIGDNSHARDLDEPTLDRLFLTHPDGDHYNRVVDLCEQKFRNYDSDDRLRISEVYYCGNPGEYGTLFADANEYVDAWYPLPSDFRSAVGGGVVTPFRQYCNNEINLYILAANYPTRGNRKKQGGSSAKNAKSMVLMFEIAGSTGNTKVILPGDAEFVVEKQILANFSAAAGAPANFLSSYALKLGHHGSAGATGDNWVNAVRPQAIFASGDMKWAHPYCDAITRARAKLAKGKEKVYYCCGLSQKKDYENHDSDLQIGMNLWYFALKSKRVRAADGSAVKLEIGTTIGVQWLLGLFSHAAPQITHTDAVDPDALVIAAAAPAVERVSDGDDRQL